MFVYVELKGGGLVFFPNMLMMFILWEGRPPSQRLIVVYVYLSTIPYIVSVYLYTFPYILC